MAWKRGPLQPDSYNWGGCVPAGTNHGFYFADFRGDHVMLFDGSAEGRRVEAADIVWYDNSLTLPPHSDPSFARRLPGRESDD
jgi:hypothetical protein